MTDRRLWTRDELILAINLYCRIPFGRIHVRNSQVIELAKLIGRTPGALSWKLVNFAHIDPTLDRKGASNTGKLDKEIWNEFYEDWDSLSYESERILADIRGSSIEQSSEINIIDLPKGETERFGIVRQRVTQQFFRRAVLSSYDYRCCITGITLPELLVASHIVPWSKSEKARSDPRNGLCLNALHDRAFDTGLMAVSADFRVLLSHRVREACAKHPENEFLIRYDHQPIANPQRFLPDPGYLEYHRNNIFAG